MKRNDILRERTLKYALERIFFAEQYDPKKGDTMLCNKCGRKVHLLNDGKGPLVCCGEPTVKATLPVEEAGFEDKPKGWTDKSIKKYSKTFTDKMKGTVKSKGFFDKCVEKMKDKMENPEGFCAALKDEAHGGDKASTYWRGKGKSEKQAKEKVKQMRAKFKK